MSLTPFTGLVDIATLRANLDDATAQLTANAKLGVKAFEPVHMGQMTVTPSTDISLRSTTFTLNDDAILTSIAASGLAAGASQTLTVSITQADPGTMWLLDTTISASVTSSGANVFSARGTFSGGSQTRFWLPKGVRMRLAVATDVGSWSSVNFTCQCLSRRRRA